MQIIRYITHPQVEIDLSVPVTRWGLSEAGHLRALALARQPWIARVSRVVVSSERKALQTAAILAERLGIEPEVREELGENDRSATGPLPPAEFEQLAARFFAEPNASVRGWERAVDAQRRVVSALEDLLGDRDQAAGDVAVVGHGGVGTLWYCALAGLAIDRKYDQPGQGHYFSVDARLRRPLHHWRAIDEAS